MNLISVIDSEKRENFLRRQYISGTHLSFPKMKRYFGRTERIFPYVSKVNENYVMIGVISRPLIRIHSFCLFPRIGFLAKYIPFN